MLRYTTLIVEDFEEFRRFVVSVLRSKPEFQVIFEASDGVEGVQRAQQLKPDLILLDIGLPGLNGIEVARRICKVSPDSKILFLTQEPSADVVQAALNLGAHGYLLKSDASWLLFAIDAVLRGERFVSRDLVPEATTNASQRHEILFCSDETVLVNGLARFIAAALNAGNAAIVWATESHRADLRQRLYGQGVNVDSAIQRGTYISSDVSEPPDPERILVAIKGLSDAAFRMGKKNPRVAICGERAGRLWAEGKTDAALNLERLLNEFTKSHNIDILCVYPMPQHQGENAFKSLCAQHTAAYSR
jgi:DNA-binding NarL/FixJ family response regulator